MPQHIRKRKLLVVSDTAVHMQDGQWYGFGPVVRELEMLQDMFDEIVWLGCKEQKQLYADTPVKANNIRIVAMPSVTHKPFNAFFVLLAYPIFLLRFLMQIGSATHVHTRGPSHSAFISILFSFFDRERKYWHKYAGDWVKKEVPFTYKLQRILLKRFDKKNVKVSVNGKWQDESANIIALENPALYSSELSENKATKSFNDKLTLVFAGNLNRAKGIEQLLEAFHKTDANRFSKLLIAGTGPLKETVDIAANTNERITPLGYLSRSNLLVHYQQAHILVLASLSEGLPKVVAEASAYGCIPLVSAGSAVAQYIRDGENGFLITDISAQVIAEKLEAIAKLSADTLLHISNAAKASAHLFTYERFAQRVKNEIFTS